MTDNKPHTAGITAAITTVAGLAGAVVSNPPHGTAGWLAVGLAAFGAILQAYTKPVNAGDTDLIPKR